ncbi:MAG: MlaD family protein [Rubripirellula sp.]
MTDANFPEANIRIRKRAWAASVSWMWLATLVCVVLAISLAWHAYEPTGQTISIRFPEGHGLKPGDALEHRGIKVGTVDSVELDDGLEGILVDIVLEQSAEAVARKGSRFWIVRPQIGLTGISGLETAVGAKYVAVMPGEGTIVQTEFEGLANRPPESLGSRGLEVILRGDDRFGVHTGAPVTWRGVTVGQVLSSSLSPDAMHVDTRVRIGEGHRRLLTRDSKFWVTSGIRMDLDVTGFELSAESLATIAQGGIAFLTPESTSSQAELRPGDVFELHEESQDEWIESAAPMNLLELEPPPMSIVTASWTGSVFGISKNYTVHTSALTVAENRQYTVWMPTDIGTVPEGAKAGTFRLVQTVGDREIQLDADAANAAKNLLVGISLDASEFSEDQALAEDRIRTFTQPEDCFAVRRSWRKDAKDAIVVEMIGREQMRQDGAICRVGSSKLSRSVWHGAAVVASQDEKVIGMLLVMDEGPIIVPLFLPASD